MPTIVGDACIRLFLSLTRFNNVPRIRFSLMYESLNRHSKYTDIVHAHKRYSFDTQRDLSYFLILERYTIFLMIAYNKGNQ